MICVSVTPASRTLAQVDLLNASRYGDMVELCIDRLIKEPDFKEILSTIDKPILISCRRKKDGGQFEGTEEARKALLRQAIASGPAYIELELDIANDIPRFGNTQRVISFTRLDRPEYDIESIFEEAAAAKADIVKFSWPTPTIDDVWPLLAAVTQKRMLPIVGNGRGTPEMTFSLLGKKYGCPWIYAALEKGMEAYPGQVTVHELDEYYHFNDINKQTRFVAVAGFSQTLTTTLRIFNLAFRHMKMNVRCLPLTIGRVDRLAKMLDILKVQAVLLGGEEATRAMSLATQIDKREFDTQYIDLMLSQPDGWHGYNTLLRTCLPTIDRSFVGGIQNKTILVIGTNGIAHTVVSALASRQNVVNVCSTDTQASEQLAKMYQVKHVPFAHLYETLCDIIIIADSNMKFGKGQKEIMPSVLRPHHTVIDLSNLPLKSPLFEEAIARGCKIMSPSIIYMDEIQRQFKALTGQEIPSEAILEVMGARS